MNFVSLTFLSCDFLANTFKKFKKSVSLCFQTSSKIKISFYKKSKLMKKAIIFIFLFISFIANCQKNNTLPLLTIEKENFTIQHPESCKAEIVDFGRSTFYTFKLSENNFVIFNIYNKISEEGMNLLKYQEMTYLEMDRKYKPKIIEDKIVKINGIDCLKSIYTYSQDGKRYKEMSYT